MCHHSKNVQEHYAKCTEKHTNALCKCNEECASAQYKMYQKAYKCIAN